MAKAVLILASAVFVLVLMSGCTTQPNSFDQNPSSANGDESNQEAQECNEVPMKYNQGDGVASFLCGNSWVGSEEYQKGLNWIQKCSLTIRNMETEESGLWKVIFKIETQDGNEQLERSRYIYPGESYTFEAGFGIKDPYRNCEVAAGLCPEEL